MVAAIENGGGADSLASEDSPTLLLENNDSVDSKKKDTEKKLVISTTPQDPSTNSGIPTTASTSKEASTNINSSSSSGSDELTFLIEVVKATIPLPFQSSKKKNVSASLNRGIHCTTSWIGPINPSGYKRRCKFVHRTKTLKSGKQDASSSIVDQEDDLDDDDEIDCTDHIFTVNDSSLFLFKTSMKQLANATISSKAVENSKSKDAKDTLDMLSSGGLRFDVFERPLDNMFTSVAKSLMADNISEKEYNALTREVPSSSSAFRLVGSVFLTPQEILDHCNEERFECNVIENWKRIHTNYQGLRGEGSMKGRMDSVSKSMMTTKAVNGAQLVLRTRLASKFDIAFMKSLAIDDSDGGSGVNTALQSTLIQHDGSGGTNKQLQQLITEVDENLMTADTTMKALGNISPIAQESVRYLFSNDTEPRLLVKPYPDPSRVKETSWLTEQRLHTESLKSSTNWIQAGQQQQQSCDEDTNSLGFVFIEILECNGLPNTDAGGAVGNKTDAFISLVYGDIMVQTDVIDDTCSPMFMPWCSRAFIFQLGHPSTALHIGVCDYDIGPLEHECIGRVAIHLGKFSPGTLYTLTYSLYKSSNLTEKGEDMGTITLRLRMEIPNEKKYLLEGWKAPETKWVNSQQWKSHRVAKYVVDGPHDEEVFEMALFRSQINELLTQKRYISYAIGDAVRSLIYWRGQVKVGNVWLPLHSAVVFYCSIQVVENLQLLPSFMLFGCGWIMIANMLNRTAHPNPWTRGHSFMKYWSILIGSGGLEATQINPLEGHKETTKLETKWKQRLANDDVKYYKQLELDAKVKSISDEATIRTKTKASANTALVDPLSALAGAKLLPYQQRLSGYCKKMRHIRNVMNWNESIISFFITLILFGAGFVALFIPWRFILQWTMRVVVWVFLGPWMWICDLFFHEETEHQKTKTKKKARKLFQKQQMMAKRLRENALKIKDFRVKLFGKYITRLPEFNLVRHEDVPLPESSAEPYDSEEEVKSDKFVPSQDLTGVMIPMCGQDMVKNQTKRQREKEFLISQHRKMIKAKSTQSETALEEEVDECFELIGGDSQVVCLHSDSTGLSAHDDEKTDPSTDLSVTRSNSDRNVIISDKAIQLALENQLGPHDPSNTKSKWVFSASIQMSLRKETVEEEIPLAICDDPKRGRLLEQSSTLEEEGVEIVPFLNSAADEEGSNITGRQPDNDNDHVSVFYVPTKDTMAEGEEGEAAGTDSTKDVKKIRPRSPLNDRLRQNIMTTL